MDRARLALWAAAWMTGFVAVVATMSGLRADEPPPEPLYETIDAESQAILARDPVTDRSEVKHILVGWAELTPAYMGDMDPRAAARTRAEADVLALQLLAQVRGGDPINVLMSEFSEDPGSAATGESYVATEQARLVEPFKALAMRLEVGEAGLVLTEFGWHIILRVS